MLSVSQMHMVSSGDAFVAGSVFCLYLHVLKTVETKRPSLDIDHIKNTEMHFAQHTRHKRLH